VHHAPHASPTRRSPDLPAEPPPAEPPPAEPPPPVEVFVEDSGLDCVVGDLPNNIAPTAFLPNPFVKLDGTPVATRADWRCRRKRSEEHTSELQSRENLV